MGFFAWDVPYNVQLNKAHLNFFAFSDRMSVIKKPTKSRIRNAWSPLLIKVGDNFAVVLLWKTYRGNLQVYSCNKSKATLFGNLVECSFNDGTYHVQDDLGQKADLLDKLLDPSIIGGSSNMAKEIAALKSRGESATIARMLTFLGKDAGDMTSAPENLRCILSSIKVINYYR